MILLSIFLMSKACRVALQSLGERMTSSLIFREVPVVWLGAARNAFSQENSQEILKEFLARQRNLF